MSRRLLIGLLLLLGILTVARAAPAPTSFCKCTCFSNSTLIQLTGSKDLDSTTPNGKGSHLMVKAGTCDDCNRQFCLKHDLPICQGAEEEDVFTTCFQRDSAKDEAVVFIFIFATVGLLIWAAIRPYVMKWFEVGTPHDWSYRPIAQALKYIAVNSP
ncbi:hypothetical protein K461DRAFT_293526 [Myriangium duriaei CBS 260.36]|uniref:Uncharacterized protein n=1 Tax=Myriangium duriaei CBS 260.36 TaxID=1168546 RepID=A0A9P4MHI2_9PEZI|nr:hypothetical protein K461DRAFT_293526 [Myriangium duriaei CBS 260.36]